MGPAIRPDREDLPGRLHHPRGLFAEDHRRVQENPDLHNLLLDPYFSDIATKYQAALRDVVVAAVKAGVPVPAFSSAVAYYDSYRSETLPANLVQAQRDFFGAHTFERIDKKGSFHADWA